MPMAIFSLIFWCLVFLTAASTAAEAFSETNEWTGTYVHVRARTCASPEIYTASWAVEITAGDTKWPIRLRDGMDFTIFERLASLIAIDINSFFSVLSLYLLRVGKHLSLSVEY